MEKENANLKYEAHALNKELAIRNEEREYERKAAEIASKQHLDSVKKIAKLEEECNRLRVLMSKKLPGDLCVPINGCCIMLLSSLSMVVLFFNFDKLFVSFSFPPYSDSDE
jgi:hypothetical protein